MIAALLLLLAVVLAWPTPRMMARQAWPRRNPRAALIAWQAVTLSAIVAAVAAAPAILPLILFDGQAVWQHPMLMAVATAVSAIMLGRLLLAGHRIGRRMRKVRTRHRELVDIIAHYDDAAADLRILEHPTPTAYCLPGRERRVVVSRGVVEALDDTELAAVLAHEHAHLRGRHDLLVEFFSVIHETVPAPVRCSAAMREVRLLIEVLADRAAVRSVGAAATARALDVLAGGTAPEAAMGASAAGQAPVRISLLRPSASPVVTGVMYGYAATLLVLPILLFASAWT